MYKFISTSKTVFVCVVSLFILTACGSEKQGSTGLSNASGATISKPLSIESSQAKSIIAKECESREGEYRKQCEQKVESNLIDQNYLALTLDEKLAFDCNKILNIAQSEVCVREKEAIPLIKKHQELLTKIPPKFST